MNRPIPAGEVEAAVCLEALREFNAAHPVLHRAQIDRAKYRRPSFTVPTEDRGSVWDVEPVFTRGGMLLGLIAFAVPFVGAVVLAVLL